MGISSDKYQEDWKSGLRREKYLCFGNFRSGTPARRQVTLLEKCVYRGEGGGITYRETELKVRVIKKLRETFNYCLL